MAGGAQQLPIHGSDHRPRGPDPIPGLAIYEIKVFEDPNVVVVGDGRFIWEIPEDLHGALLVKCEAFVTTPSSSGSVQIQLRRLDDGVSPGTDMLSTKISIEATEFNSKTAALQPVVNVAQAALDHGDHIAIDIDAAGVGAKGLGLIAVCAPLFLATAILEGSKGDPGGIVNWRGVWATSTSYSTGDAVSNNGSSYVARQAHVSGASSEPGVGVSWETYWMLLSAGAQFSTIGVLINGNGYVILPGVKADKTVPFACTIVEATLLADAAGNAVVDIWKDTYGNYPPTDADSITASAPLTLSSAIKTTDTVLTGWTKTLAAGDTLRFNVDSCSAITRLTCELRVERT